MCAHIISIPISQPGCRSFKEADVVIYNATISACERSGNMSLMLWLVSSSWKRLYLGLGWYCQPKLVKIPDADVWLSSPVYPLLLTIIDGYKLYITPTKPFLFTQLYPVGALMTWRWHIFGTKLKVKNCFSYRLDVYFWNILGSLNTLDICFHREIDEIR